MWRWVLGSVLLTAVAVGATKFDPSRSHSDHAATDTQQNHAENKAAIKVKVVKPRQGGLARTTTQPGTVHAFEYARLYGKVSGFLHAQVVDIGDTVKQGQVVGEIYAPEYQQRVEQGAADVEQAQAEVQQAEAMVVVAKAEIQAVSADLDEQKARVGQYTALREYRQKEFIRYNQLAISKTIDARAADEKQNDFEAAHAGEVMARAAVLAAEGRLTKAQASLEKAKADVRVAESHVSVAEARQAGAQIMQNYTQLISPYTGVITDRSYHDGDFIRAADSGSELPPIVTVARTDLMRVVVYVPDRDVPYVDREQEAVVRIDALEGEEFKGHVARFSNIELAANRTMRVEVDLPNPTGRLREGMYGNVSILLRPPAKVLAVPSPALVSDSTQKEGAVYVVRDGHAVRTPVQVGRDNGLVVEILSGLSPNDEVVVSYGGSIEDGSPVEAQPAEASGGQDQESSTKEPSSR